MPIPAWIATIATAIIPAALKKKPPFILWYLGLDLKWAKKSAPISARQCKKACRELVRLGMDKARFAILREGTEPPKEGPKC